MAKQGSGRLIMTAEIAILEGRMEMFVPFLPLELSCFLLALIGDVLACLAFIFAFVSSHSQCMKTTPKSLIQIKTKIRHFATISTIVRQ